MFKKNKIFIINILSLIFNISSMNKLLSITKNKKICRNDLTHQEYLLAKKINFYQEFEVSKNALRNEINVAYAQRMNKLQSEREKINPSTFKKGEGHLQMIYCVLSLKRKSYNDGLDIGIYKE